MTHAEPEYVFANELCGLPCNRHGSGTLPLDKKWTRCALNELGIALHAINRRGGKAIAVRWNDLPAETRTAYILRAHGVTTEQGIDPALWSAFAAKSATVRAGAEKDLAILESFEGKVTQGMSVVAAIDQVCAETGVSTAHVYRLRTRVRDVPRVDWLPTLAANYSGGRSQMEISEDAWTYCLSFLKESSGRMPLSKAHRETATAAKLMGWTWPSYVTVLTRWNAMPAGEKALIKSGINALDKTIPPMGRSVAHLQAMQIVNLDGRQADFFVRWEDGTVGRPICIAIQDVYSRCILGWRLAKTEDADTTKAVILDVFDRHGLFDELRTDNGRAFASKKISGGTKTRFRGRKPAADDDLGVLTLVGCRVGFAKPRRGQSKPIERGFRDVAEQIDTLPEFKGAYCGHRPDAKPEDFTGTPVDVAVAREVYERELRTHNEQPGRRTEAAKGKLSFAQVFADSFRERPRRDLTQAQRSFFMFDMKYLKPNKDTGALSSGGFTWWAHEYQDILLKHRNSKVCVLFDPNDRSKPVIVRDAKGRTIIEKLPCLQKGRFDSTEDARQFERGKAQIKAAAKRDLKARNLMTAAEIANIRKRVNDQRPTPEPPTTDSNITKPLFGTMGVRTAAAGASTHGSEQQEEFSANTKRGMDILREALRAG